MIVVGSRMPTMCGAGCSFVVYATVLVSAEVCITAAIAMLFSSFSTPFVTGLLTFGAFLAGRSAGAMLELRGRQLPAGLRDAMHRIAAVIPNLQVFVPSRSGLLPGEPGIGVGVFLAQATAYAGLYSIVLLVAAMALFRRRDLT